MHSVVINREKFVILTADELIELNFDVCFWVDWRDNNECFYCGAKDQLGYDHLIPWSQKGSNSPDNLVCACRPCNRDKKHTLYSPEKIAGYQQIINDGNRRLEQEFNTTTPISFLEPGQRWIVTPRCPVCRGGMTVLPEKNGYIMPCLRSSKCPGKARFFRLYQFLEWVHRYNFRREFRVKK